GIYVQQKNNAKAARTSAAGKMDESLSSENAQKKVVVLDAGHGGKDVGTDPEGASFTEADVNLQILQYLVSYLEKEDTVQVICTRTQDEEISREQRVLMANQAKADLFVSIHCNSGESATGTEVMYMPSDKEEKQEASILTSRQLSEVLSDCVSNELGIKNRGLVNGEQIEIIRKAQMPAALVEAGFLNGGDQKLLLSRKGQKRAAKGLYHGIIKILEEMENE
ncbi:MAG: N-acetylmuramoyl-L-alanine amidase, partial [Clostridiales bacterium]|nr:N-acetylmuramoyl-L-alanine amidase [Clostridiales bacterium]